MRHALAVLLTAAMTTAAGNADAATVLPVLQWHYRVIAVFTDDASQAQSLRQTLEKSRGIAERDIAWFVVGPDYIQSNLAADKFPDRPTLEKLHTTKNFQTVLVGKDGGVKARQDDKLDLEALFGQIDQMPMRRREMREQG